MTLYANCPNCGKKFFYWDKDVEYTTRKRLGKCCIAEKKRLVKEYEREAKYWGMYGFDNGKLFRFDESKYKAK